MARFVPPLLHFLLGVSNIIALSVFIHLVADQYGAYGQGRAQIIRNTKAAEVLKYMNLSADPCNNFYDFACGSWPEYQPTLEAEGDAPISVQTQLLQLVRKQVGMLFEPNTRPIVTTTMSERTVKEFYSSCLAVHRSSESQHGFSMNFVKDYHDMPLLAGTNWNMNYDWVEVIAQLRLNYGFDFLIGMDVKNNVRSSPRGVAIYLTEPKTTLIPRHLCSVGPAMDEDARDEISKQLQTEISQDLQVWLSLKEHATEPVAGDIIRFEFELCKVMREEESLPPSEENQTGDIFYDGQSLSHVSKKFDINFKNYLEISLNSSVANSQIVMKSEQYFLNLSRIIRSNTMPTLANYIMYRALAAINFPRNEARHPSAGYCADLVMRYFPKVIGELYKNKYERREVRKDVSEIFYAIKKTLQGTFSNNRLSEKLIFPTYGGVNLVDLHLERENFWHKQDIAMKYNGYKERQRFYGGDPDIEQSIVEAHDVQMKLVENGFISGWGILQPPIYDYYYSKSLKFALIGQRMARELVDAVLQEIEETPDESSKERLNNITECYRMQYSNYWYNMPNTFYNVTKVRELMTDSAGLNLAFDTYLAWLEMMDPNNLARLKLETFPDVNFTNTQLFFISFAQSRCFARYMETPPPEFLPLSSHTEELFDVNGVLANSVEFAREFGCALGSEMNPDDKCTVY